MTTKRWLMGTAIGAVAFAFGVFTAASAHAGGQLNMLTWEGYTDPSFVKAFEAESGCKVNSTYVGSNDEFPAKLAAGGGVYDMVSPSIDTDPIMVAAGFVQPIDTSKLKRYDQIFEKFRTHPGINIDGKVWGIPYTWGAIPFMYRKDSFTKAPTSVTTLWTDPSLTGKISLWDDKTNIYFTARMLFGKDVDVYNLTDAQLAQVRDKLIALKPKIRKFWSTAGELVNLVANGEVTISNTWGGYQSAQLDAQGIKMVEFIPVENADGWADSWQIVKGTPNLDCAYKWLNFAISPKGQCGVVGVTGYSGSNPQALKDGKCLTEAKFKALHENDFDYINKLDLWQTPKRVDAYINTWNAVKAAQ